MAKAVCGRFAPTPSGRMHLGNVFCALLAWLSAKKQGGTITLRIEDLDKPRCPAGSDMLLEDDLHWLGLEWDTGGSAGGKDAPYYQSRRFDIYAAYFAQLQKLGLTYPCFCNRAELHAAQAPHLSDGRILYAGTCRHLTAEQTAAKTRTKDPHSGCGFLILLSALSTDIMVRIRRTWLLNAAISSCGAATVFTPINWQWSSTMP